MSAADALTVAQIVSGVGTPLAVVWVGHVLDKRIKDAERQREEAHYITESRLRIYDDVGFKLNDLFAYYLHVGLWKELSCDEVLKRKRELDRCMYTYQPLFSQEMFKSYVAYMNQSFETFQGMGEDAKLRTSYRFRKEERQPEKRNCFTGEDNRRGISNAYEKLMACLATDLGLAHKEKE